MKEGIQAGDNQESKRQAKGSWKCWGGKHDSKGVVVAGRREGRLGKVAWQAGRITR